MERGCHQGDPISPFRTKGQISCTHHKGRQLDHYCKECQVPFCIKCVSTIHKSHPVCDLSEITPQIKNDMSVRSYAVQGSSPTQHQSERPTKQKCTEGKEVASSEYILLPHTKVLGRFCSPCAISFVCPTTDGQVWTRYYKSVTLTLLNREGEVIQEVKHKTVIRDLNLSPTTNTLWVGDEKNNITELVSGRLIHRFSTRENPLSIYITASSHVIVGMAKHISKFTTKGKMVHTTSAAGTGRSLMCRPYGVSECPVTHNVAVADWSSLHDGGEGKPRVFVTNTDFKERFVYGGEVPHTYQPTSQSGSKRFTPWGVVYDSVGNLPLQQTCPTHQ